MDSSLRQGALSAVSCLLLVPGLLLLLLLACPSACASASKSCEESGSAQGVCASPAVADTGKTLVLYGNPASTCTRRVLLALYEKGLTDFKLEVINLQKGEQKQPAYMEMQPFGQIPVLKDGELTLFESRAIARYIAEKYEGQGTPLLGSTPQERALVNVWFEAESQEFNPQAGIIYFEMVVGVRSGRTPNGERAKEASDKLEKVLDVYEERLESHKYLAGDNISLADLSHMPYLFGLWPAGYSSLIEDRPNVHRWWKDLSVHASWSKIING